METYFVSSLIGEGAFCASSAPLMGLSAHGIAEAAFGRKLAPCALPEADVVVQRSGVSDARVFFFKLAA
jgi:hypothetical protein